MRISRSRTTLRAWLGHGLFALLASLGCGGETKDDGSPQPVMLPEPEHLFALIDPENSPGQVLLMVEMWQAPTGTEYDVELLYRSIYTRDQAEDGWLPLPAEAILEVPPGSELDGSMIRGLAHVPREPWAALVDVRPLSDICHSVDFGLRVVGNDIGYTPGFLTAPGPEGWVYSWPAGQPPHMEVDIQGDVTVEQEGDRYEVTVVVDNEEAREVGVRVATSPRQGQTAPTTGCWHVESDDAARKWPMTFSRPDRDQPSDPYPWWEDRLTVVEPGTMVMRCTARVHDFRNCLDAWGADRPDITRTVDVVIRGVAQQ